MQNHLWDRKGPSGKSAAERLLKISVFLSATAQSWTNGLKFVLWKPPNINMDSLLCLARGLACKSQLFNRCLLLVKNPVNPVLFRPWVKFQAWAYLLTIFTRKIPEHGRQARTPPTLGLWFLISALGVCFKIGNPGNSLMVQWLGLYASSVGCTGLIRGCGTKVLKAVWHNRKKNKPSRLSVISSFYSDQDSKLKTNKKRQ